MPLTKLLELAREGSYEYDDHLYGTKGLLALGEGSHAKDKKTSEISKSDDYSTVITLVDTVEGDEINFVLFHKGNFAGEFFVYNTNGELLETNSVEEKKWYLEILAEQQRVLATNMLLLFRYEVRNWLVEALHKTEIRNAMIQD